MSRRTGCRALVTMAAALLGAIFLSGSDQPVTAHSSYPHWQVLPAPPLAPRTHALGVPAGHRVLVLGGLRSGTHARHDGAAYDLTTGVWHRLRVPVAVTDRDSAVEAAGVVVLRHQRAGLPATWWRYDVRGDRWSRVHDVPRRLAAPSAFGSEVYAMSGRRVVVYSIQLGRWTSFPRDPHRPVLIRPTVTASRAGTVVLGHTPGHPHRVFADRWDGLRWHRARAAAAPLVIVPTDGATRVRLGGRTLVVRGDSAWIRLP